MPIFQFDTLEQIPEALRQYAKAEGEKVQINLVPQDKLEEFRESNTNLLKERDALKKEVEVLKPIIGDDAARFSQELVELQATAQRVKDGTLTDSKAIEQEVVRRTEDMKKSLEEQIRTAQKEGALWKTKATEIQDVHKRTLVTSAIKDALIDPDLGVQSYAFPDILSRAQSVWRAQDNGQVLAFQGDLQLYGSDGGSPLSPKEWISKLKDEAPHYFKGTTGGGAGGDTTQRGQLGKTQQELRSMRAGDKLALANGAKPASL